MVERLTEWDQFVHGLPAEGPLRSVILESWCRSEAAGLERGGDVEISRVSEEELRQRTSSNADWLAIARPHLKWLTTGFSHVPHVVYLTDREGIVLESAGCPQMIKTFGLSPGHDWSEAKMGTNGAGTALVVGQPVAVVGDEHFINSFQDCTCTAAPIHSPDGTLVGAIDVSTSAADASPDRLSIVAHAAYAIGRELRYERQEENLRKTEQSLRESEARLQAILDNTSALIYLMDDQNRFVHINRRWQVLFGLTNDDVAGRTIYDFFPREVADQFRDNNRKVLEDRLPLQTEEIVPLDDGEHTYITLKVPLHDAHGRAYAVCGISTDITQRKKAEQDREHALATLSNLVSSAPLGIALLDREMRFQLVNDPLAEMNGIAAADHVGKTVAEVVPHLMSQSEPIFRRILETGKGLSNQLVQGETAKAPGVQRVWWESWFPVGADGAKPAGVGVIIQEITEQRQAEERLRQKNERLRLLSQSAEMLLHAEDPNAMLPDLFSMIGPHVELDTYLHFVLNDSGSALQLASCAGIPEPSLEGLAHLDFGQAICGTVALERKPIVASHVQKSHDEKTQLVKSLEIGAYACFPLMAGDEFLGTLSFGSRSRDDFTPEELDFLKTLSHYLAAAYERVQFIKQLQEADRRKDEFLAMLAHELRNPLAPIRSGLDILSMNIAAHGEIVPLMQDQVEHLVRLVDDLLDVSRIMQGKVELRKEPVAVSVLVTRSVKAVRPLIKSQKQDLTVRLPEQPIWVDADPVRIVQVIENLLNNASKYTDSGGNIELAVGLHEDEVAICVRDTGIGIEPGLLPLVFELFTQSSRSLDRAQGGLGIGLTLVKRLVEMHGGTVLVHSDGLGKGSTFTVRLPVADPCTPASEDAENRPLVRPRRVLVVEDNVGVARMLSKLLAQLNGHAVEIAHDGTAALEKIKATRPEIVLLDIGLPGIDGFEVATTVRQDPQFDGMLLVALTGYGQQEDRRKSKDAGFDEHLVKPPTIEQLQDLFAHPKLAW